MTISAPFVPWVVLKFDDSVDLPYADDIGHEVELRGYGAWSRLAAQFPGIRIRRLYRRLEASTITELVDRAVEADSTYVRRNLLTYFVVECPEAVDPFGLAHELNSWPSVEGAYVDRRPAAPQGPCSIGYEDPADGGMDAQYAWSVPGGQGEGQHLIDVETGWTLTHDALAVHAIPLPAHGVPVAADCSHGTSVLAIACGRDLTTGFLGIAPNVQSVQVVSYSPTDPPPMMLGMTQVADAILYATTQMTFGDVLLLEVTTSGFLPCETSSVCFDNIRLATAIGIVVIEPSGNTASDLDSYLDPVSGSPTLFRGPDRLNPDPGLKDSLAIMVASASSAVPHTWRINSNYGTRIDCYAWGDGVFTARSANVADTTSYAPPCFLDTSAAAAMIAGAALSVQGMVEAAGSRRFSPQQLRDILGDPNNGIAATGPKAGLIGVMPNLRTIATQELNRGVDVYVRDFAGDIGDPSSGAPSRSPDVIVRAAAVASGVGAFGAGSGTENDDDLSDTVQTGADHYVYVRLQNRGATVATNVTATVYWSPPSTLITPDMWTLIGTTVVASVPIGRVLTVSDPITWLAAQIPAPGHYCFMVVIGNAQDPMPFQPGQLSTLQNWNGFLQLVTANNNVVWRNFNVVSSDLSDGPSGMPLDFLVSGAPDEDRAMRLEVVAHLPEGSSIRLAAPQWLIDAWRMRSPSVTPTDRLGEIGANANGALRLRACLYPARSHTLVRLLVNLPEKARKHAYDVYARQLYEGIEVGRVTWRLRRDRHRSR